MHAKKNPLFLLIGLMATLFVSSDAAAFVWTQDVAPIPAGALTNGGKKVNVCHRTGSSTNPFVFINISINGLNGHDNHSTDEFLINGLCGGTGQPPAPECKKGQIRNTDSDCIGVPKCKQDEVINEEGDACIAIPTCTGSQTLNAGKNACDSPVCEEGEVLNTAGDACITAPQPHPVPTVNKLTSDLSKPTLTGTVGNPGLDTSEAFSVMVDEVTYHKGDGHLSVSGVNWSLMIPTELSEGIYEVDAVRNSTWHDQTHNELEINDTIAICDNGVNKSIDRDDWIAENEGTHYYLGQCGLPECTSPTDSNCTPPLPRKEDPSVLPNQPNTKVNEMIKVDGIVYCADGGLMSDHNTFNAIIKRARIANATTEQGNINIVGTKVKYGVKVAGAVDITNALIDRGKATGVTITGATLNDVYLDTPIDYINLDGTTNPNGTFIPVMGGTTKPTTLKENNSITTATITSGMITAGTDEQGNPVRGSVIAGHYAVDIPHATTVLTQGRRTKGKLINATIQNATITTVNGVTVIDEGTVTSGTMAVGTAATFGTVINATLTGVTVSNSNHCFSSGTVGSRGQLNWKEVIKNH